jgi:hypothetical protein
MTKAEAAETLVTWINVRARHYGVTRVDKTFIEEMRAEALSSTGLIKKAAEVCPHWTTIRSAARRLMAG